jgi:DNA-binding MarR family transcriptional regulator
MTLQAPRDPIAEATRQWIGHWGKTPAPSLQAVTSIMRVQQILTGHLNRLLKPFGLSFSRYEALMLLYLSRNHSLPLSKIGERLQVHPTSITGLIDGLERLGFVVRGPHESDRRTTLASITPAGIEAAEAAAEILNNARFGVEKSSDEDLTTLTEILSRMREQAGDVVEHNVPTTSS